MIFIMEEYIDYSNSELEEKLKNVFGDTYGSLQPLIIDILLRRSYVFKISNEKTVQDAKRVLDNLDIVEFCHIHGYTLGMANPSGKSIRVREQYYNETKQYVESNEVFEDKFLATFVHELLHILSFHFETVDRKTGDIIIENCINKVNKNAVYLMLIFCIFSKSLTIFHLFLDLQVSLKESFLKRLKSYGISS